MRRRSDPHDDPLPRKRARDVRERYDASDEDTVMDFLPWAAVLGFLVIYAASIHLGPPWMAFAFIASVFAVLWLFLLRNGWPPLKLLPDFAVISAIVLTVLGLGGEAWLWRHRSRSQQ
jgi:hypothetical protein